MTKKIIGKEGLPPSGLVELETPFVDERGAIIPIVNTDMKSCVMIHSKKGTVRANHYHLTDWHYCYILDGELDYYHRAVGDNSEPEVLQVKKGEVVFTPPMVEHAMVYTKDCSFITLGGNSRDQQMYEKDLVRVQLVDPASL